MAETWKTDTGDVQEEVHVVTDGRGEQRVEVVENTALARAEIVGKLTTLISLLFVVLEALIGLRIFLKLIAANPASTFAGLIYAVTDLFLWPFSGLTASPNLGGMVFEVPAVIAMVVYALAGWVLIQLVGLLFRWTPTRTVSTYERDRRL